LSVPDRFGLNCVFVPVPEIWFRACFSCSKYCSARKAWVFVTQDFAVTCFSFVCTEPACALGSCFILHQFRARCFFSQGCPFLALDPTAGPGLARVESAPSVLPHSRSPVAGSICFFSCLPRAGVCWSRFLLCEHRARSPPPGCVLVDRSVQVLDSFLASPRE
jgi:hypothetical protein